MIALTIRTDKPDAEIGLFEGTKELGYESWQAHRELGVTIHTKILTLLKTHQKSWPDLGGIVFYKGPGSFTGLRIGATVANTLADSLDIAIVAAGGDNWLKEGLSLLENKKNNQKVVPFYDSEVHITKPVR